MSLRGKLRVAAPWAVWTFLALLAAAVFGSGCWNDDCDPACREGYACYYGVCLSRGYCPLDDPHVEDDPHCVEQDEDGECTDWRGLCTTDYSCECISVAADGTCRQRSCQHISTIGDFGE